MPLSIDDARNELRVLVSKGVDLSFTPQGPMNNLTPRKSAVLILFGALDHIPATTGPNASPAAVPPELDVLLMRRSDQLRHHPGQISFPGGGTEPGDSGPAATALREAAEETGLDPAGVEVLGCLPDVHIPVSNNLVTPVVAWWAHPSTIAADHSESVEVFRLPVADLIDPGVRGTSVLNRNSGGTFRGDAFRVQPEGHILWGFTGIMLSNIFELLGWAQPWDKSVEFEITA